MSVLSQEHAEFVGKQQNVSYWNFSVVACSIDQSGLIRHWLSADKQSRKEQQALRV